MTIEAAILAGGKNSRYGGQNKAFIEVGGSKIIDRNLQVLNSIFSRISIITNSKEAFSDYENYPMSSDYYTNIGPLAGIHSALKNGSSQGIFITSCDMPFLDIDLIKKILAMQKMDYADAIIPRISDKIEPLFGFYNRRIIERIEQHIIDSEKRSVKSFLAKINTQYLNLPDNDQTKRAFLNINRPEDLSKIEN